MKTRMMDRANAKRFLAVAVLMIGSLNLLFAEKSTLKDVLDGWEQQKLISQIQLKDGVVFQANQPNGSAYQLREAIGLRLAGDTLYLGGTPFTFTENDGGFLVNLKVPFDNWVNRTLPQLVIVQGAADKKIAFSSYSKMAASTTYNFEAIAHQFQLEDLIGNTNALKKLELRDAIFSILVILAKKPGSGPIALGQTAFYNENQIENDPSMQLLITKYDPNAEAGLDAGSQGYALWILLLALAGGLGIGFFVAKVLGNSQKPEAQSKESNTENRIQPKVRTGEAEALQKLREIILSDTRNTKKFQEIEALLGRDNEVHAAIQAMKGDDVKEILDLAETSKTDFDLGIKIIQHFQKKVEFQPGFDALWSGMEARYVMLKTIQTVFPNLNHDALKTLAKRKTSIEATQGIEEILAALGYQDEAIGGLPGKLAIAEDVERFQEGLRKTLGNRSQLEIGDYLAAVVKGLKLLDKFNGEANLDLGLKLEPSGHRAIEFFLTTLAIGYIEAGTKSAEIPVLLHGKFDELCKSEGIDKAAISADYWDRKLKVVLDLYDTSSKAQKQLEELSTYFDKANARFPNLLKKMEAFANPPKQTEIEWFVATVAEMALHYRDLITVNSNAASTGRDRQNIDMVLQGCQVAGLSADAYRVFSKVSDGDAPGVARFYQVALALGIKDLSGVLVQGVHIREKDLRAEE